MSARSKVTLRYTVGGVEHAPSFDKARFDIGRSPRCDVTISEEKVSRRHAVIARQGEGWIVEDTSTNGTFLNDDPTRFTTHPLSDGDTLWIGEIPVRIELPAPPPESRKEGQRVVFDDAPERRNKTAVFNMADLGLSSEISEVRARGGAQAAAWAISLFSEAAQGILKSRNLDDMFGHVLELAFKNLPAERGLVALWNPESEEITPRVTRSRDGKKLDPIKMSRTIAMEAITLKQAFSVGDALQDIRFGQEESIIHNAIHAAMCAPICMPSGEDRRVVGVLYVDHGRPGRPFPEEDLKLLSALAAFAAVAVEQRRLLDEIRYEQDCRAKLSKYNSPQVVERIMKDARRRERQTGKTSLIEVQAAAMIAEERDVTVLFADLSGFTSMAEKMPATDTAKMLNDIFDRLTRCIFELEGTLDKFMGDAVMAFFGAPLDQPDHARRAVSAALAMQRALKEFNDEAEGRAVRMRIGVNTGMVVAGDIGSPERKDYTVIGDVVNVASRLESSVAKPGQVVVGPETRERLEGGFLFRELEALPLKGKSAVVQPFLVEGEIEG